MRKMTKRSAALVAGSVLAVAGGTAAFAYASGWFSGGGTAYANASAIRPISVTIDTRSMGNLYPNREIALPSVSVTNNNDYPVKINKINVASVTTAKGDACDADDADIQFGEISGGTVVEKGTHAVNLGTIKMLDSASSSCAGQFMTITATMEGEIATHTA